MLVHLSSVFHTFIHLFILKMRECLPCMGIVLGLEITVGKQAEFQRL